MRTIALRFADNIAPQEGTIAEHEKIVEELGYVWYGKFGLPVSKRICATILNNENPRILLVNSCKTERYWAFIDCITRVAPDDGDYPNYYADKKGNITTWFRITRFNKADKDICSKCFVCSSGNTLTNTSRTSMSPYFFIEYKEAENE